MYKMELFYHLVLVTKYRYTLKEKEWLKIKSIIKNMEELNITEIESYKNHIHILTSFKPKYSISYIIKRIKQLTTHNIHPKVYFGDKNILWSRGYYVSTVGNVNVFTIKKYIENQNV